jgi:hypothetical protein
VLVKPPTSDCVQSVTLSSLPLYVCRLYILQGDMNIKLLALSLFLLTKATCAHTIRLNFVFILTDELMHYVLATT